MGRHSRFTEPGKVARGNFVANKKTQDSSKNPTLRPSQALRFRIDSSGSLRAMVSASSGEFSLTPEIIQLLCLLQQGIKPDELAAKLRTSFKQLNQALPDQTEIIGLIDDLIDAQCILAPNSDTLGSGIQDGFGDSWIQWAMLADAPRCRSYKNALQKTLNEQSNVLDVGAGSGLLSLYALEAKAHRVDAIEETAIAHSLKKLRSQLPEELRKRLTIHNCNSFDATLPQNITHVVSELFGNDPLQEGVVPTLRNIFSRIENKKCVGIPENVSIYLQLIDLVEGPLHKRLARFSNKDVENGDLWFKSVEKIKGTLDLSSISFSHPLRVEDIKQMSPLRKTITIQLAPPPSEKAQRPHQDLDVTASAKMSAPALLLGFRAKLSHDLSISNLPGESDSCEHWSPILVPLNRCIEAGETLQIKLSVNELWDRVILKITDNNGKRLGSRV